MDNPVKKNKTELKNIIRAVFPLFLVCFFMGVAWIWGNRGEWVRFSISLAWAIIIGMWFPALLVCQKLDKRFDQLEKLLDKKSQSKEKVVEQDTEKSTKP